MNPTAPFQGLAAWYCVQVQPKHERLAAAALRGNLQLEVFLPQIRFRRPTRQGVVWVTEGLFLNYAFARFDLARDLRRVHSAPGVRGVVHFRDQWPSIPDSAIAELKSAMGYQELYVVPDEPSPGNVVQITGGPFQGLRAVVACVLPGKRRVAVLLDFLGRQSCVEFPLSQAVQVEHTRPGSSPREY